MPKVHKHVLVLIAGLIWTSIGILLFSIASKWFILLTNSELIIAIIGGLTIGGIFTYFGFGNLAVKNIKRINLYAKERVCIWAFQRWQSYIMIGFMISLGIFMRTSSFVPKSVLAPMYIGMGLALFTASFKYYIFLYKLKFNSTAN